LIVVGPGLSIDNHKLYGRRIAYTLDEVVSE
jgi:hypothetical protein